MSNILEPLVNAVFSYGEWIYNTCFKSYDFNFNDYFKCVNLKNNQDQYPKLIKDYEGVKGRVFLFNIPIGLSKNDFDKHKEGLEAQLKENIDIRLINGFMEIEVLTKKLKEKIDYKLPIRAKESICIPIGESIEDKVSIDLRENPHSYIVGTTGSGKSVCTKGILTSLVNNYSADEVELYLCDLKMVELALFRNLEHTKKFVYEVNDTTEVIANLLEETKNRYSLFMDRGVTSIFEYNKINGIKKMKYQVLYIEEVVILLEDSKKKAMKLLKQLIAISRASGCYVFITTQRPSSDIIDNVVKANINNRIVFKVEDKKNSVIALDSEEAENLKGSGHGILKVGGNKSEFQSYFITDTQVKEYTKAYIRKEPIEATNNNSKSKKVINIDGDIEKANRRQILKDLSFLDNL